MRENFMSGSMRGSSRGALGRHGMATTPSTRKGEIWLVIAYNVWEHTKAGLYSTQYLVSDRSSCVKIAVAAANCQDCLTLQSAYKGQKCYPVNFWCG